MLEFAPRNQGFRTSMSAYPIPINIESPGANLEAYVRAVNAISVLSVEEERALAERLHGFGDVEAARQLVLANLRFVIYIARSYSGYGLSEADLIQEGNVGLMKAVKRFNPEFQVRLVSFAVHWIKAEIHEFILRNWRIVRVATTKAQRKLFFNLRSQKNRLGWLRHQEVQDIAEALGVKPETVLQMEGRLSAQDPSFELPDGDDEETFIASPSQFLAQPDSDPANIVEHLDTHSDETGQLREGLAALDERARDILTKRWLIEPKSTLQELAGYYGISAERVRQLEQAALKKLRLNIQIQ
jgi:RNA polymerase sigma-32 factor